MYRKARDVPLGGVFITTTKIILHRVLWPNNDQYSIYYKNNKQYICAISVCSSEYQFIEAEQLVI